MSERLPNQPPQNRIDADRFEETTNKIEAAEPALGRILEQIRSHVEEGSYRLIIGEDAQGRIPALILSNAIGIIYKAKGREKPLTRFIGGTRSASLDIQDDFDTYIGKLIKEAGVTKEVGRVLIVTEIIQTGVGLHNVIEALDDTGDHYGHGVGYDVATLTLDNESLRNHLVPRNKIVNGDADKQFSIDKEAIGVHGRRGFNPIQESTMTHINGYGFSKPYHEDQEEINHTREVVGEVAERLAEGFLDKTYSNALE